MVGAVVTPAVVPDGEIDVMVGPPTLKDCGLVAVTVPVETPIWKVAAEAVMLAGIVAVSWVELTKVVFSGVGVLPQELHNVTMDAATKLEPKTEMVASPEPDATDDGEIEVMAGPVTVKG